MADLPAIGTRWGDLTPEQKAALPIGTKLRLFNSKALTLTLTNEGWCWQNGERSALPAPVGENIILSYPEPDNAR